MAQALSGDEVRRLRELLDKEAIREVMNRYVRGSDRCDPELMKSAYWEDAFDDHGSFKGNAHDFVDRGYKLKIERAMSLSHILGSMTIDLWGDEAFCETYFLYGAQWADEQGSRIDVMAARFVDRFERRASEWKIANRVVTHDWSLVTRGLDERFPNFTDWVRGRTDRQDLSYSRAT